MLFRPCPSLIMLRLSYIFSRFVLQVKKMEANLLWWGIYMVVRVCIYIYVYVPSELWFSGSDLIVNLSFNTQSAWWLLIWFCKNLRRGHLFKPHLFFYLEVFSLLDFLYIFFSCFYSDHEYYSTVIFLSANKFAKLILSGFAISIVALIG